MVNHSVYKISLHFIFFIAITSCFPLFLPRAEAVDVTLAWDPNEEPDLAGYILYRRQGPSPAPFEAIGTYPEENLANPLNPRATATDLQSNTAYYFAVTAYDTDGNESAFSNRVCVENGVACQGSGGSSSSSGGGGGGGGGCMISTAADGSPMDLKMLMALLLLGFFAMGISIIRKRRN